VGKLGLNKMDLQRSEQMLALCQRQPDHPRHIFAYFDPSVHPRLRGERAGWYVLLLSNHGSAVLMHRAACRDGRPVPTQPHPRIIELRLPAGLPRITPCKPMVCIRRSTVTAGDLLALAL
jgi:hypothetical protein